MRLQRIYSSKIYVTSTRKDRIHAAINSPINAELVRQLSDYLDDDAKRELSYAIKEEKASEQEQSSGTSASEGSAPADDGFGGGAPSPAPGGHSGFSGDIMSDFGDDELADVEPITDEGESGGEPSANVEESTAVAGTPIKATSIIWTTIEDVASDCDVIKGTLNAKDNTSGVSRLQVKENELWIYFNDSVNLNDKMIDVIETLNATGYTYLAFSRLARSDNAIVFDVNLNTDNPVVPKGEIKK